MFLTSFRNTLCPAARNASLFNNFSARPENIMPNNGFATICPCLSPPCLYIGNGTSLMVRHLKMLISARFPLSWLNFPTNSIPITREKTETSVVARSLQIILFILDTFFSTKLERNSILSHPSKFKKVVGFIYL